MSITNDSETLLAGSSPAEDLPGQATGADATADSSTANSQDASGESSTPGDTKPDSMAAQLAAAEKLLGETEAGGDAGLESGAEESPATEEAESGSGTAKGAADKQDEPSAAGDPGPSDVEFHKRAEWQELVKLGGDKAKPILRKLLGAEHKLREQLEQLAPAADVVERLHEFTGGDAGFKNLVALAEKFATEPNAAVPMLEQLLTDARKRGGLDVVSDDLKRKLEAGTIDQEAALELERERAARKRIEAREADQRKAEAQRQLESQVQARTQALNEWEKNIAAQEPDYARIQGLIVDRALRMTEAEQRQKRRPLSPEEMVGLAQNAYEAIKAELGQMLPKRNHRPVVSNGSSTTARAVPKTYAEATEQLAQQML